MFPQGAFGTQWLRGHWAHTHPLLLMGELSSCCHLLVVLACHCRGNPVGGPSGSPSQMPQPPRSARPALGAETLEPLGSRFWVPTRGAGSRERARPRPCPRPHTRPAFERTTCARPATDGRTHSPGRALSCWPRPRWSGKPS